MGSLRRSCGRCSLAVGGFRQLDDCACAKQEDSNSCIPPVKTPQFVLYSRRALIGWWGGAASVSNDPGAESLRCRKFWCISCESRVSCRVWSCLQVHALVKFHAYVPGVHVTVVQGFDWPYGHLQVEPLFVGHLASNLIH